MKYSSKCSVSELQVFYSNVTFFRNGGSSDFHMQGLENPMEIHVLIVLINIYILRCQQGSGINELN